MRRSLFVLASSALFVLGGCAAPQLTTLEDGTVAYQIDCDGTARGLNYCLEKAGRTCAARGYVLYNKAGERVSLAGEAGSSGQATYKEFEGDRNRIIFQCEGE